MKAVLVSALFIVGGCSREQVSDLDVHPGVFEMVQCWLSDNAQPVVTEFNLDAVAVNRNQFDRDGITRGESWTSAPGADGHGYMKYRVLFFDGKRGRVEYLSNGGGTLTTSAIIGFEITRRTLRVDGKEKAVRILRVHSFVDTPGAEP